MTKLIILLSVLFTSQFSAAQNKSTFDQIFSMYMQPTNDIQRIEPGTNLQGFCFNSSRPNFGVSSIFYAPNVGGPLFNGSFVMGIYQYGDGFLNGEWLSRINNYISQKYRDFTPVETRAGSYLVSHGAEWDDASFGGLFKKGVLLNGKINSKVMNGIKVLFILDYINISKTNREQFELRNVCYFDDYAKIK